MTTPAVSSFDPWAVLPSGITVLEASAGTGKTHTIASLAARYIAQGTPLRHLLVVTFTRMATGELRDRVRRRLLTVSLGLQDVLEGRPGGDDELVALLSADGVDEVWRCRQRIEAALSDYDAATITTTHGFCQHALAGLGLASGIDELPGLVDDSGDLISDIVDDLYVQVCMTSGIPGFSVKTALEIASAAVANPTAPIVEAHGDENQRRRRLGLAARTEFERRKRRLTQITYDDLLTILLDALDDPVRGAATQARLRSRFHVALVDEFQDTDPVQWQILHRLFDGHGTLVLIGDPKQAIYAFRGADVYAYLDAARSADHTSTLSTNWRSDSALIEAFDSVFSGVQFGHPDIEYRRVAAADSNIASRIDGAPIAAPMRVRIVHRDDGHVRLTKYGYVVVDSARDHIANDLACDVVDLLDSDATISTRSQRGSPKIAEGVRPGHIAVLVRRHQDASTVRDALAERDVPAVVAGAQSVFGTDAALEWLRLLEALERPTSRSRVASAALTQFIGWSATQVHGATELEWEDLHAQMHEWAELLRVSGIASVTNALMASRGMPARVLERFDGERVMTDVTHIAELIHVEARASQLGPAAVVNWMRRRIVEADDDVDVEERSRRLDSDAEAVQVITIHRSKGLEFPIVYVPYLWDPTYFAGRAVPVFHDHETQTRMIDVSCADASSTNRERARRELRGEELRLAYVAMTRAQSQVVLWWAGSFASRHAPLTRLLCGVDETGAVAPEIERVPRDEEIASVVADRARRADADVSVERTVAPTMKRWRRSGVDVVPLGRRRFNRSIDTAWRRTSYSRITVSAHESSVWSEPTATALDDEPVDGDEASFDVEANRPVGLRPGSIMSAMNGLPTGPAFGTLVHGLLERTDFSASELVDRLESEIEESPDVDATGIDSAALARALAAVVDTPLGASDDAIRLRDIGRADRLDELEFEYPLAGGDVPSGSPDLSVIAEVLDRNLTDDDPLAAYADELRAVDTEGAIRGYLTGSIDLVARVRGADHDRYIIADYKTNRVATHGRDLTLWDYRPSALTSEMIRAHYPLQALLYSCALHRYLRWRLADYDPAKHLGGVYYLFLRGMNGAQTPVVDGGRCGVFVWRPPSGLIESLSDAIAVGEVL